MKPVTEKIDWPTCEWHLDKIFKDGMILSPTVKQHIAGIEGRMPFHQTIKNEMRFSNDMRDPRWRFVALRLTTNPTRDSRHTNPG